MYKIIIFFLFLGVEGEISLHALPTNIEITTYNIGTTNTNQIANNSTLVLTPVSEASNEKTNQDNLITTNNRVFGTHSDYSLELPTISNWKIFRDMPPGNNDLDAGYQNIHIMFNAKPPTMEDVQQVLARIKYRSKQISPDMQFSHPDIVELDGLKFFHIYEAYFDPSLNAKFATSIYLYSGSEGFFSIVGMCPANTFSTSTETFNQIAKSWKRGPKMIAEYKASAQKLNSSDKLFDVDNSAAITPERVESIDGNYSVEEPDNLKWKYQKGEGQIMLFGNDITFVVTFSKLGYDSTEDVLDLINSSYRSKSEIFKPSDPVPVEIDGLKWLSVTYNSRVNSLPLSGIYYVITSNKGTFTMTGSTGTNLIQENAKIIEKMAKSFLLSPSFKADLVPTKPREIPKTYIPSKVKDHSTPTDIDPVTS